MRYSMLTYEEISARASAGALAVVPLGCIEQQGPHLAVGFDTWFADELCLAAAERARERDGIDALVLPVLPFGPTPEPTSLALYRHPDQVRPDRVPGPSPTPDWSDPNLDFTRYSVTGVIGDPTHASSALGARLWKECVEAVADALRDVVADPDRVRIEPTFSPTPAETPAAEKASPPALGRVKLEPLADELACIPGVVAVVLGGSRATGAERPDSDWDIGVYYRGSSRSIGAEDVRRLGYPGHVVEPGEWGPIVNGGAWLEIDGMAVDVLYRDLDVVERWTAEAQAGRFEILAQTGYLAGAPTYLFAGELALCRVLRGELPRPCFPEAIKTNAKARWLARAAFPLVLAESCAERGDPLGCAGMLSIAVLSVAHARMAERGEWALNEKGLAERAGLGLCRHAFGELGHSPAQLRAKVARMRALLGLSRPPGRDLDEVMGAAREA